ncbi:hypothetical protein A3860_07655 [Niastella vici]|uniref:DUF4221 domain-containing protein n=1 Tax=Niastella vici TaxID=1703345 RepID=A0A1V9FIT4_9BACT|nr:DUF4221 family protein [Niastella vici]OQP58191.1 hypothetical protein A3860_07655 [Niastella vici]
MTSNNKQQFHAWHLMLLLVLLLNSRCRNTPDANATIHIYIMPQYGLIKLLPTTDTLHFPLDENSYNAIKSTLSFVIRNKEYVCFHDQRAEALNIYDLHSRQLIKRLELKKILSGHDLYKTSAFVKNFDSIFVTNNASLYLVDSAGHLNKTFKFLQKPELARAVFDNNSPPVIQDNQLYAGVRPSINETSLRSLAKWKAVYSFDLLNGKAKLHYSLPRMYQENYFGYHFLEGNYCYNNNGYFVFSFPADTNVYESDLAGHNLSYCGKSQYQTSDITPVKKEDLLNDKAGKQYMLRDSYGAIYFDGYHKRYLRLAKQKISEADFESKNLNRKRSILIFDEHLKIIGESLIDENISFSSLFISADGNIYARTRSNDEYALHFVRLAYVDSRENNTQLTKN